MRRAALVLAALLVLLPASSALAQIPDDTELDAEMERQLDEYDLADWELYYAGLPEEVRALWGGGVDELVAGFIQGGAGADSATDTDIFDRVWALVLSGLRRSAAPLGMMLGIALLSGLSGVITGGRSELSEAANFVCLGMFAAAAVSILLRLVSLSRDTVEQLARFIQASSPVIATMIAATGSVAGGGLVQPLTALISDTMTGIFKTAVLPLILAAAAIAVAGSFSGKRQLARLSDTIHSLIKWITGIAFTVFLGIISIRGISAAGADSLSVRTLKYTLDKGIPIVGGAVSGTLDTARGCAVLIKNAAGITAILIGLGLLLVPLIEIAGASITLRLASAASEPIADERMSRLMGRIADICGYLAAAVIVTGLMFVITLGVFIAMGKVGV